MVHSRLLLVALSAALVATAAAADGPSVDCAKVAGKVPALICQDPALSALDRKLDEVWKEAEARNGVLADGKADFDRQRDACAKDSDPRACLERTYTQQIARIQAAYSLVSAIGPVEFVCEAGAKPIVATFFQTEPPSAILKRDGRTVFALLGPTGSGARYEAPDVVFWNKGRDAMVTWFGAESKCSTH